MKPQHQVDMAKLSTPARDLQTFTSEKKPMLGIGLTVMAKCKRLWDGLTGAAVAHSADDYFRWSYEFSCTTTPVIPVKSHGCSRRRRLPPCVGGKQAREMLVSSFAVGPRKGCSPEDGMGHEIDGLAEDFINRFHEQLRMQRQAELQASPVPVV